MNITRDIQVMGVVTDATTSAGFTTVISPFYNQSSSANTLMKTTSCSPPATPPKQQQQQQQQQVLTQSAAVVASPCAACKILRRRCAENCVLAPYFPPTEPLKFTTAHRVFGASNIIKFLQELPESQRADAVSSMVYEANARIRDPVYGCAGAICQLQKQVNDLQAQLAKSRAQILNLQFQLQAQLMTRFITHQSLSSPTDGGGNGGGGGRFPLTTTSLSPSSSSTLSPPEEEPVRIIDGYFPTSGNLVNIDDDVPGSYCAYLDVEGMQSFGWEAADMILG